MPELWFWKFKLLFCSQIARKNLSAKLSKKLICVFSWGNQVELRHFLSVLPSFFKRCSCFFRLQENKWTVDHLYFYCKTCALNSWGLMEIRNLFHCQIVSCFLVLSNKEYSVKPPGNLLLCFVLIFLFYLHVSGRKLEESGSFLISYLLSELVLKNAKFWKVF